MSIPIQFLKGLAGTVGGAAQKTVGGIGNLLGMGGGSSNTGQGRVLSDAEFQSQLKAFMPQWNTAYNTNRMAELEKSGQKGGWEYQMLSDQNRPGWNVPQGNVAMSAGNQHEAQLMQFADKGIVPNADLLATARSYDASWNQGAPVTKLPVISSIGDMSGGAASTPVSDNTEQFGPRGLTGAGGNNQGNSKTTTFDYNNGLKSVPNPGNPQFTEDANSAVARLRNVNPSLTPPDGTPGGGDVAGVRNVNGSMEAGLYAIPPAKVQQIMPPDIIDTTMNVTGELIKGSGKLMQDLGGIWNKAGQSYSPENFLKNEQFNKTPELMKGPMDWTRNANGTITYSGGDTTRGPAMGVDGFLQRSGSPTPAQEQLTQQQKTQEALSQAGPYIRNMNPVEQATTAGYEWLRQKFFPTQLTLPQFYSPFGNFKIGGH